MKKISAIALIMAIMPLMALSQNPSALSLDDVSQSVLVTVRVNKKARIEKIRTIDRIEVSPADSAKGYVDIPRGVNLAVWCNSLDGVVVNANLEGGIYDPGGSRHPRGLLAYRIDGCGQFMPFNGGPMKVYESYSKEKGTNLCYDLRLYLPSGSTTGIYRFNMEFTASPK